MPSSRSTWDSIGTDRVEPPAETSKDRWQLTRRTIHRENAGTMPNTRRLLAAGYLPLAMLIAGCGVETYQARVIENSVPLFRYEREMNANLAPEWRKGEVRMRLPAGLKEIPGPKKKDDKETRLPSGLPEDLPGVLGGFRGKAKAISAGGQNAEAATHVLVLSNRALLASRTPDAKPDKYDTLVVNAIATAVGQGTSSGNIPFKRVTVGNSSRDRIEFGSVPPEISYDSIQFDTTRDDVPMRYEVYVRRQSPLIVAVVFLVPRDAARSERLRERIDLSLQTLRIDQLGSAGATPSAGGSAGAGGGGGAPSF
jgi:hypothetical protein